MTVLEDLKLAVFGDTAIAAGGFSKYRHGGVGKASQCTRALD